MNVTDHPGPHCPNCQSQRTDRLLFQKPDESSAVYFCDDCSHVWRVRTPKPPSHPRKKRNA